MNCPKCRNTLPENAKYCLECGISVSHLKVLSSNSAKNESLFDIAMRTFLGLLGHYMKMHFLDERLGNCIFITQYDSQTKEIYRWLEKNTEKLADKDTKEMTSLLLSQTGYVKYVAICDKALNETISDMAAKYTLSDSTLSEIKTEVDKIKNNMSTHDSKLSRITEVSSQLANLYAKSLYCNEYARTINRRCTLTNVDETADNFNFLVNLRDTVENSNEIVSIDVHLLRIKRYLQEVIPIVDSEISKLKNASAKQGSYLSDSERCVYCGGEISIVGSKCKSCEKKNEARFESRLIGGIVHTILTALFIIILLKTGLVKSVVQGTEGVKAHLPAFIPMAVYSVLMGITSVLFRQKQGTATYYAMYLFASWVTMAISICIWKNSTIGGWVVGLVAYFVLSVLFTLPYFIIESIFNPSDDK